MKGMEAARKRALERIAQARKAALLAAQANGANLTAAEQAEIAQ